MNHVRRFAGLLAALACALLASAAAAPAAFAMQYPHPGGPSGAPAPSRIQTVTHTVIVGGMPGWQIALIAAGAALTAATAAVLVTRARAARLVARTA
jgi:hypothetical protein